VRVKLTALVGDNATSGLLVEATTRSTAAPTTRVGCWSSTLSPTASGPSTGPSTARSPIPSRPMRWSASATTTAIGPSAAAGCGISTTRRVTLRGPLVHLQQMERDRYHLTAGANPGFIAAIDQWHKEQWRRRQGEEPER
jgi:hypothetical protein